MKKITITFCAAVLLFACNSEEKKADTKTDDTKVASSSSTQSTDQSEAWVPVDSAAAMKAMEVAGTPGEPHAMLAKSNGNWTAETTMWMSPDAPPMKSSANVTNKMVMGGRYQQSSFKGTMMGMPFEGESTTGYDNARKTYFTTWMDNWSTAMMNMDGTWDDATKSINFKGKMLCPANGKWCEMREVYKVVDDKNHVMEMYGPDMKTGKEYKSMEIKFTKK